MDSYDDRGVIAGRDTASAPGAPDVPGAATAPEGVTPPDLAGAPEDTRSPGTSGPGTSGGIAALSLPYQLVAALALAVVGVVACVHLGMVFLHVAPSNTLTKQNGEAVDDWIYPEFEQNWKLFAPNPLQQNISVQVRAQVRTADGQEKTSDWIDLTAQDGEAIRGNLLPSHTVQNALRRSWDFYTATHDNANKPNGLRGALSERYVRRTVMLRLDGQDLGGEVERIQVRSETVWVKAPPWSEEKTNTRPAHRVLPWWPVTGADLPEGVRHASGAAR